MAGGTRPGPGGWRHSSRARRLAAGGTLPGPALCAALGSARRGRGGLELPEGREAVSAVESPPWALRCPPGRVSCVCCFPELLF